MKVPIHARWIPGILLLLFTATLIVYWPVGGHPFIVFDDEKYVVRNPNVLTGLTLEGGRWAFTTFHASNWHPLTWISHMTDVELFGLDAGWHHRMNLLLHLANVLILFRVLYGMTGASWRSGFVAALFAVHPMHVESVAWIAERKDLLCGLFGLLATWAYWRYATRGGGARYLAVAVFFLMGLMSKPMIVTLPLVFLLLDYWPLGRVAGGGQICRNTPTGPGFPPVRLVIEKVPLLLLSLGSCVVTFIAQQRGGAMGAIEELPVSLRLGNAILSYGKYLGKFLWPDPLSIIYPHAAWLSSGFPWWQVVATAAALATISWAAWRWRHGRPYFIVGWSYYLGTLVPVIGLVQVGMQAMADRYMYLPLIGVSVIMSWGLYEFTRKVPWQGKVLWAGGAALLVFLSVATSHQVSRWRNSVTLFRHAMAVTPENWTAYLKLADALLNAGEVDEAIRNLQEVLRHRPEDPDARLRLGLAFAGKEMYGEAAAQFRAVLNGRPEDFLALVSYGLALASLGRNEEALNSLRSAVVCKPDSVIAYTSLGRVLLEMGRRDEAIDQIRRALRIDPNDPSGNELMRAATEGREGFLLRRDLRQ